MRLRKLRIAFSTTCLIACVLLIVLWVRSYWRLDALSGSQSGTGLAVSSSQGKMGFFYVGQQPESDFWAFDTRPIGSNEYSFPAFGWQSYPNNLSIFMPHW